MARRSDHTRDELKQMVIDSGHSLISSQGLSQFSARQVASHIGYTVGTIYNVFGSHDALLLHINAKTLDRWFAALEIFIAEKKKPATFAELAYFYIDYAQTHYHEWMALFEHTLPRDQPLPDWYTPKLRRFFGLLEEMMLPLVTNRRQARRAARVLWAGIHGICLLSLSRKLDMVEAESAHILAKSFVENYVRGLQHG